MKRRLQLQKLVIKLNENRIKRLLVVRVVVVVAVVVVRVSLLK